MIASIITTTWNALIFILRNPQIVLGGWTAMWAWLLYASYNAQGLVGAIQFASTGLLNMGSVIGLPIPALMAAVMLAKQIQRLFTRMILRVWKMVQAESVAAVKKAGAAVKKAVKAVRRLKAVEAEHSMMLGGGDDYAGHALMEALGELETALGDADLAMYLS